MINQEAKNRFDVKYGYGVIGSSSRFIGTDTNDFKFIISGSQNFQSSYGALLPPYTYNGIGRSNNYAENFVAAGSFFRLNSTKLPEYIFDQTTPVIPNS